MSLLENFGIKSNFLINISSLPQLDIKSFTNGLATDLHKFALENGLSLTDYFCKWLSSLTGLQLEEINKNAVLSKLNRTLKTMKNKRGVSKDIFLKETFVIPVQTPKANLNIEEQTKREVLEDAILAAKIATQKFEESNKKFQERRETTKYLKRKLDRKETAITGKKLKIESLEKSKKSLLRENDVKSKKITFLNSALAKSRITQNTLRSTLNDVRANANKLKVQEKLKEQERDQYKKMLDENEDKLNRAKETEKHLKEAYDSIHYLSALLEDTPDVQLYDNEKNKFNHATVECVMNLTDLKVPVEKVGQVIKTVSSLCGKNVDRIPSATTVNRIVDSKLAVAQKQIASVLSTKSSTTLYTDETRKYGKSLQTYLVTDEEQNSYILGLREMIDKSGQSTLDTLKDILTDISTYCHQKERENDMNVGYKILANIRDTMSDRASTEKRFNVLLEEYRSEVLPHVYYGWTDLNDLEKEKLTHMNNFFCGLHLLVGMADVCESTVKKFELNYLDGKDIGSSLKPELKKYQKNESGTLRLIRTASKAFAVGQDEKNGISLPWQTYLHSVGQKNHIVRFKHNRFNLAFSLALSVYHHRFAVSEFLDKFHGTSNDLLKAVTLDIKENLYLAGLKAFGLISKLITGPLWKLLESAGHIFEMNVKYKELVDFLQKGANDVDFISKFVNGEETPFETIIGDDPQTLSLFEPNDQLTEILYPLLQALFLSMHELLNRMVADHLPGGKFAQPTEELYKETKSVMKHNKLPEFVFGQLDQLLRYRPNATLLTNEAYLMYSHNKSRVWLAGLQKEEKESLLESCLKEGKVIRRMFKVRLKEIEAKRLEIQEKKKQELIEKERKRVKLLEGMTQDICFFGLWQSVEQVEEGLNRMNSEKEQRDALQAQLKFRKNVLKQKHSDKKIFNFSMKNEHGKYVKLTVDMLKQNVIKLIQETLTVQTHEHEIPDIPLLVGKRIEHKFLEGDSVKVYQGKVISVVPGFGHWYNVKYDNDIAIYAYNLHDDYKAGDLKILISGESSSD